MMRHEEITPPLDTDKIVECLDHCRRMNRIIAPVYHSLLTHVQMQSVYIGASFTAFAEAKSYCCFPGCDATESFSHLFWQCRTAQLVWRPLLQDWRHILSQNAEWRHVIVPNSLPILSSPTVHTKAVLQLWSLTLCSVMRIIWLDRNAVRFKDLEPSSIMSLQCQVSQLISLHLRHLLCSKQTSPKFKKQCQDILHQLGLHQPWQSTSPSSPP
jgi:hypothetical protein